MKKRLFTLALAMTLTMPLFAIAAENQQKESTLTTEYTINSEVAPDTVKIKFYIENQGINLADVKEKNDKVVNAAMTEVKKKLAPNETIKTISFRVNNIYSYKEKVRVFSKYEVTNGFEVKLKDLNKISEIIKIAIDNGIKRVENLNFSVEDGQKTCNEMMAQAILGGKQRAEYLAKAAGTSIDKVKSINPYCSLNNSYVSQPRYYSNASMKADSMGATEDAVMDVIEPGSINVRTSVNMTYYLK